MPDLTRDQAYAAQRAATATERTRAYDNGIAAWHARNDKPNLTHLGGAEIANCGLCNPDGYRGTTICDHVDRSSTHARGIQLVREALERKNAEV